MASEYILSIYGLNSVMVLLWILCYAMDITADLMRATNKPENIVTSFQLAKRYSHE